MKKIVDIPTQCSCGGELCLDKIQVDFISCVFVLFCECILCGLDVYFPLGVEEFINLNQLLEGKNELPSM